MIKNKKKLGYYNRPLTKTRRVLDIKAVLGRMTDLMKKNCSVYYATNNWMIVIGDGKAREHRMMTDKIIELDQLLIPSSQMTKKDAERFIKRQKSIMKAGYPWKENVSPTFPSGLIGHVCHYKCK